ncbi:MAG: hypothetical protein FJW80_08850 [Actinobacteria bacterium]|nr:hypothetical protein [Actinomycetota bacterium]
MTRLEPGDRAPVFTLLDDRGRTVSLTSYKGKTVVGVIRSTFVIGSTGRIERAMYAVKATGHIAKLRRDLGID